MYGQLTVIQQTLLLGCCRQILLLAVNCDGDRWTGGSSVQHIVKMSCQSFSDRGKTLKKRRTDTATGGVLSKKVILNKFIENPFARISFLIKLQEKACNFIKKRGSDTSVFLWILRNFLELDFYRTPLDDCFWKEKSVFLASSEMLLGIVELMDNSQYRLLQ